MRVLLQPKVQRERMVRLIDWSLISNFFIATIAIVNPLGKGNYSALQGRHDGLTRKDTL